MTPCLGACCRPCTPPTCTDLVRSHPPAPCPRLRPPCNHPVSLSTDYYYYYYYCTRTRSHIYSTYYPYLLPTCSITVSTIHLLPGGEKNYVYDPRLPVYRILQDYLYILKAASWDSGAVVDTGFDGDHPCPCADHSPRLKVGIELPTSP